MKGKNFAQYIHHYADAEVIDVIWLEDDVRHIAAEQFGVDITQEEIEQVCSFLGDNHDAEIGINWDSIFFAIDYLYPEFKNKRIDNN
jgi:hypothetical protein